MRFAENAGGDPLSLRDGLYQLTGYEDFDVLDLRRAGMFSICAERGR
ncbi:MAG TPA: hypothetical protein VK060_16100 [Ruania sp.]|nr:hypothetical protein [Ruania sp.]